MTTARLAEILQPSLKRVRQLTELGPDWDSYGALSPSREAIGAACGFLETVAERLGGLVGASIAPYTIVPLAGGGVQLVWRGPGGEFELEVGAPGTLAYLLIQGQGTERRFSEAASVSSDEAVRLVAQILTPEAAGQRDREYRR